MKSDIITQAGHRYRYQRMAADPSAGSSGVASEMPTDPIEVLRILRSTIERIDQQLGNLTQHEMYSRSITVAAIDSALELLWGRDVLARLQDQVKDEIKYAPDRTAKDDGDVTIEEPGNIVGMSGSPRPTPANPHALPPLSKKETSRVVDWAAGKRQRPQ